MKRQQPTTRIPEFQEADKMRAIICRAIVEQRKQYSNLGIRDTDTKKLKIHGDENMIIRWVDPIIDNKAANVDDPIQSLADQVPEGECKLESNSSWTRSALLSVLVIGATPVLDGCNLFKGQSAPVAAVVEFTKGDVNSARDAFGRGYHLEARNIYATVPKNQLTDYDLENIKIINAEIEDMISDSFKSITAKTKNKPEDNDYYEAIEDCRELRALLKLGDKRLEMVKQVEIKVMKQISFLEEEYRGQHATLKELLQPYKELGKRIEGIKDPIRAKAIRDFLFTDQSLAAEDWKDVKNMFERLRMLRIKIRKGDRSLTPLALEYVNAFNLIGDYERAGISYDLADNVQLTEGEFQDKGQINRQEKRRRRSIDKKAKKQRSKNEKIVYSIERIFIAKRYSSATQKVNKSLNNPELRLNDAHRERLEVVLEKIANGSKRKRRWKPRRKVAKVAPATVNASSTEKDAPAVEIPEEGYDKMEVRGILRELSAKYEAGNHFEAIVSLEEAIVAFQGSKEQRALVKQRKRWNPTRNKLINSYMAKADDLFAEEDEAAIKWYQKVIDLKSDSSEVRRKAKEALGTLRNIMKD